MAQAVTSVNDYYKKIVGESTLIQGNGITTYDLTTIDASVLLSSQLLTTSSTHATIPSMTTTSLINNSDHSNHNNNNNNDNDNNNDNNNNYDIKKEEEDSEVTSYNDPSICGPLWSSFMGTLPPTSITDSSAIAAAAPIPIPTVISVANSTGDCVCNVCSAVFGNNVDLVEHLKTHLIKEERSGFICVLCGNEYRHKYNLKRHLKKAHQVAHDDLPKYVDTNVKMPAAQTVVAQPMVAQPMVAQPISAQPILVQTLSAAQVVGTELEGDNTGFYQTVLQMPASYTQPNIETIQYITTGPDDTITDKAIKTESGGVIYDTGNANTGTPPSTSASITSSNVNGNSSKTIDSSNGSDKNPCHVCGRVLSTGWSLKRHLRLVHKIEPELEDLTPAKKQPKTSDIDNTIEQLSMPTQPDNIDTGTLNTQVCPICQQQFIDYGIYDTNMQNVAVLALRAHLDECHPLNPSSETFTAAETVSGELSSTSLFCDIEDTAISMLDVLQQ